MLYCGKYTQQIPDTIMPSFARTIEKEIDTRITRIEKLLWLLRHQSNAAKACEESWTWEQDDDSMKASAEFWKDTSNVQANSISGELYELNDLCSQCPEPCAVWIITNSGELVLKLA